MEIKHEPIEIDIA